MKLDMLTQNPDDDLLTKNAQRLFLVKDTEEQSQLWAWDNQYSVVPSQGSIGILPVGARKGDSLYQIGGITQAVVLRKEQSYCCIVGPAVLANTLEKARATREDCNQWLPFQKVESETIPDGKSLDLYIDIAKAFLLLD